MTTENKNTDATGASAEKPENVNATNETVKKADTPQEILAKRMAELDAKSEEETPASAPAAPLDAAEAATAEPFETTPKEEQPEIKPSLNSEEETATVAAKEATMADAQEIIEEEGVPAPVAASPITAAATPETEPTPAATPAPGLPDASLHHDDDEHEEEELAVDLSVLSLEELRQQLVTLLKSTDARKRYKTINEIQRHYDLKFQELKHDALEQFKSEGGADEDFDYHPATEHQDLEKLLTSFRETRYQERQQSEEQRTRNLERKRELLTKLRELVESAETKNSGEELKKLQQEWKGIGPVPAGEAQQLWDSYHALLDIFYNNRSIFYELKELDRKRNLDAKLLLIERAEALEQEPSINKALQELRHLHEEWKNIGPVPNDQRDVVWDRFIVASEKVHEHRRAYQEDRKSKEMLNLATKRDLLERLMAFQGFNTDRINEWRDKTDEIQKLKEEWDAAGLVPKEYAEEVNKTFWSNYKAFFQHKNQFFKTLDDQKMQNLRIKTELCEEAESLKDSTDWNSTKEKLIQLQKKWKTIGRVPDKYSDKIWQRFRSACNEFFDRKQAQEQQRGAELDKMASEKMALCDTIAAKLAAPTATTSLEEFEDLVTQWNALDKGKRSSQKVEEKFLALMADFLERVPQLSYEDRNDILVRLQVERLKQTPDAGHKLQQREQTIRREISQLQNDIQTLRTNIEFFARSKNADKLREEYEARIEEAQKRIDLLHRQQQAFRG
ncbi:DUF349 domain-containing protein [Pontibacter qinzhouensis]|uniref:DUF349 domain-containing protein n=1 Tax=Pontibacter qinzhouensis TaxID=2603253 RepID=A0A5C8KBF6_9BACT|nr:DUF349 domain-containing protein [Pontibacter qinzhouensis]TXK52429.1 DUF349 domain-containing protein [Pontibacter qinzhouensis]